jgi:hypothetical protein
MANQKRRNDAARVKYDFCCRLLCNGEGLAGCDTYVVNADVRSTARTEFEMFPTCPPKTRGRGEAQTNAAVYVGQIRDTASARGKQVGDG